MGGGVAIRGRGGVWKSRKREKLEYQGREEKTDFIAVKGRTGCTCL